MPCSRAASKIVTPSRTFTEELFSVTLISFITVNFLPAQGSENEMSCNYNRMRLNVSTFTLHVTRGECFYSKMLKVLRIMVFRAIRKYCPEVFPLSAILANAMLE